jgi:hypothetical protein
MHLTRFLAALTAIGIVAANQPALADAPTHEFILTLVQDWPNKNPQVPGSCLSRATLTNLSDRSKSVVEVQLWYKHPQTQSPAALSYTFPALAVGRKSDAITDHVEGVACKNVAVTKVLVVCPEERDNKCKGFKYVKVRGAPAIKLTAQSVAGK